MSLLSGVDRQSINPTKPLVLFGYPHTPRISTGIHDPLYATAIYLEDMEQAIILVSVDVLMLDHQFLNACREAISSQTGVPTSHIMVSTTHTHSAPVTMEVLAFEQDQFVPPPDKAYMNLLKSAIVTSAVNARKQAVHSFLCITSASIEGVGRNRNNPDGPRDPEAGILVIKTVDTGKLSALVIIYSMHPTVLHEDSTLVSADFPGMARAFLERRFPGIIVGYHNGPSGNLSPRYDVSGQTFGEATRLGRILAESIIDAIQKIPPGEFSNNLEVSALQHWVSLPRRTFPSVDAANERLKAARSEHQMLVDQNAPHGPRRTAEVSVFGAEEMVLLAKAQESGQLEFFYNQYQNVEIQVFKIGDVYIAALPGELFVEYALEIKTKASQRVFVISLANGELQGYIVTPEATGYEADFSLFEPESGKLMVNTALSLISELEN